MNTNISEVFFEMVAESKQNARQKCIRDCEMMVGGNVRNILPDKRVNQAFFITPK